MTREMTVFDLRCTPCGCHHEEVGRGRFSNDRDVISAVESCSFACNGLMIGCAHGARTTGFFCHDGRAILKNSMKQHGIVESDLNGLYEFKGHLDVLKRRACGRVFPLDATVADIKKSPIFINFTPENPLTPLMKEIFYYADNPPKSPEAIEACDLIFFNADKLICDQISIILERVKNRVKVAVQLTIVDSALIA